MPRYIAPVSIGVAKVLSQSFCNGALATGGVPVKGYIYFLIHKLVFGSQLLIGLSYAKLPKEVTQPAPSLQPMVLLARPYTLRRRTHPVLGVLRSFSV